MSVNSSGVPLFAGLEDIDDMFMATMEEMDKEVVDEISVHHPVWRYLETSNLIEMRKSIGTHVPVKLLDKENSTVQSFAHYDDVDNTPQDALSEAKFAYGGIVGTQMYSHQELVINSGPEQLIDLVETKTQQLKTSATNHAATLLMGSQDFNGRDFMGLGRVFSYDQPCGTIDPTTPGFAYWNPQRMLKPGGGSYALATEFRAGLRRLERLCALKNEAVSTKLDCFIVGEDVYDEFQKWAEERVRLTLDELRDQRGWGDFQMFPFNGRTIIYDPSMAAKSLWACNFKEGIRVRGHSGTWFQFQPWQMMPNKVAKKRDMLTYVAVYVKKRNLNGFGLFT